MTEKTEAEKDALLAALNLKLVRGPEQPEGHAGPAAMTRVLIDLDRLDTLVVAAARLAALAPLLAAVTAYHEALDAAEAASKADARGPDAERDALYWEWERLIGLTDDRHSEMDAAYRAYATEKGQTDAT